MRINRSETLELGTEVPNCRALTCVLEPRHVSGRPVGERQDQLTSETMGRKRSQLVHRLRRQQKDIRASRTAPAYGGVAGLLRGMLLLAIILLGFDFLLPAFLNQAIVGGSLTGQAMAILFDKLH